METIYYFDVVYTGIVENSKFLKAYIKRSLNDAINKGIEADEFFYHTSQAVQEISFKFQGIYSKGIQLYILTKQRYIGEIYLSDVDNFKQALNEVKNELHSNDDKKINLASIFNENNNAFEVCKGLLNDLEITIDGVPNTQKGRVGKLTGLITAIKETPGMIKLDSISDIQLLKYFNYYLHTSYKTFSKRNENFLQSYDDAKRFIKNNFKK